MNKLWTIAAREYLVRVKSKSFIIATILTPLAFGVFVMASALITHFSQDKEQRIIVFDESHITGDYLPADGLYKYEYSTETKEQITAKYQQEEYSILVQLPIFTDSLSSKKIQATYLSKEKLGISSINRIESDLRAAIKEQKINLSEIDKAFLSSLDVRVNIENADFLESAGKSKESKLNSYIGSGLGFVMGFLMYMVIFIYGGMVMRSVMEEKINRIVEVIISSVKPFQLMLGKILGVGAVGLTQLLFWLILIPIILFVVTYFMGGNMSEMANSTDVNNAAKELEGIDVSQLINEFFKLNWILIIPVFIIYFLGGYFIYASLFAGMGAAMGDDMGESQSLMVPIFIPVILAFAMLMPTLNNPNGNLAIFGSMFPLFSPILMPARLAFDPPWWQIAISILLLIITVIFMIWVAGRIYRIGILLYGKKINLKEIAKWIFYKG